MEIRIERQSSGETIVKHFYAGNYCLGFKKYKITLKGIVFVEARKFLKQSKPCSEQRFDAFVEEARKFNGSAVQFGESLPTINERANNKFDMNNYRSKHPDLQLDYRKRNVEKYRDYWREYRKKNSVKLYANYRRCIENKKKREAEEQRRRMAI